MDLPIGQTEVEVIVATRDEEHCEQLLQTLGSRGYPVERLK